MDNSKVKAFFDMKAAHWDERKTRPIEVYDKLAHDYFNIKKGDRVLDLGCGSGTFIPSILKESESKVIGMDISANMIDLAIPKFKGNPNVEFIVSDFYDAKCEPFDVIVCHNGYSHFIYPEEFKAKALELLKPHGVLAITHFLGWEEVNFRHSHANPMVARALGHAQDEAKLFLDEFDIIKIEDEPCYSIILRKKN